MKRVKGNKDHQRKMILPTNVNGMFRYLIERMDRIAMENKERKTEKERKGG